MTGQEFLFSSIYIYLQLILRYFSLILLFLIFFLSIFTIYFVCYLFSGVILPKQIYVLDTPVFVGVYENIPPGTCTLWRKHHKI